MARENVEKKVDKVNFTKKQNRLLTTWGAGTITVTLGNYKTNKTKDGKGRERNEYY